MRNIKRAAAIIVGSGVIAAATAVLAHAGNSL
jgi:hypothetical protein